MAENHSTQSPTLFDLASHMGHLVYTLERLTKLALNNLSDDTDSDKSRACLDAALRYIDDLQSLHNTLDEISVSKGGAV